MRKPPPYPPARAEEFAPRELEWIPAHDADDWRQAQPGRICCRIMVGHRRCEQPAVLELNRGLRRERHRHDAWWPYCAEHAYGRVLHDG